MNSNRVFGRLNGRNSLEYTEYTSSIHAIDGEEWTEISNTRGDYYVSNKGRIKMNVNPIDLPPYFELMNPFLLHGRLAVRIKDQYGRIDRNYADRLVLRYFYPHPDQDHLFVKHLDGDQLNCELENLEWDNVATE